MTWPMANNGAGRPRQLGAGDRLFADGNTTYTGGNDGRLISWETAAAGAEATARTVQAHDGWLRAIAVSPDGKLLATCGNDNLVKVWNAPTASCVHELKGHARHVYNVAFHPTAPRLVSGDLLSQFKDWDVATGKLRPRLQGAGHP